MLKCKPQAAGNTYTFKSWDGRIYAVEAPDFDSALREMAQKSGIRLVSATERGNKATISAELAGKSQLTATSVWHR